VATAPHFAIYGLAIDGSGTAHTKPVVRVQHVSLSIADMLCIPDATDYDLWFQSVDARDRRRIDEATRLAIRDGTAFDATVQIYHKRQRQWRTIRHVFASRAEHVGRVTRIDGFVLDVTEQSIGDEARRSHDGELAHTMRLAAMGEMVAQISHEVNQPLFAIWNYIQACLGELAKPDGGNKADVRDWLQQIAQVGSRSQHKLQRIARFVRRGDVGGTISLRS
jgi:C4-dicarboxylate-specific signal transduction histidine kinase